MATDLPRCLKGIAKLRTDGHGNTNYFVINHLIMSFYGFRSTEMLREIAKCADRRATERLTTLHSSRRYTINCGNIGSSQTLKLCLVSVFSLSVVDPLPI